MQPLRNSGGIPYTALRAQTPPLFSIFDFFNAYFRLILIRLAPQGLEIG